MFGFVSKQKYENAVLLQIESANKLTKLQWEHDLLQARFKELMQHLTTYSNNKSGQYFRDNATLGKATFTDDELKKLIYLCHPDKHNNCQAAVNLTAKLLKMRKG